MEKRWREACKHENENPSDDSLSYSVFSLLPTDSELGAAFVERKQRLVFFVFSCTIEIRNCRLMILLISDSLVIDIQIDHQHFSHAFQHLLPKTMLKNNALSFLTLTSCVKNNELRWFHLFY